MVNTNRLRGFLAERGVTQKELAKELGISENTLCKRLQTGVFKTDEIDQIRKILHIENISDIFLP